MVLVSTSCFDEVILAERVFSGSQVITKFDQIFLNHILTDLILLFFSFLFYGLNSRYSKISGARFCLMSSWLAFKWISTSSRFRNSSGCFF